MPSLPNHGGAPIVDQDAIEPRAAIEKMRLSVASRNTRLVELVAEK
jgi:hypothetical protein